MTAHLHHASAAPIILVGGTDKIGWRVAEYARRTASTGLWQVAI